jgi:inner membrane protein
LSFHLHLLGDIVGSRGEGSDFWAVPYFWPLSTREFYWTGQWPLNGWQNFIITGLLLAMMFYWAGKRGYSPLELVSSRADQAFVRTLRKRFSF